MNSAQEGNEPDNPTTRSGDDPAEGLRISVGAPGRRRHPDQTNSTEHTEATAASDESSDVASMFQTVGGQPFFEELARRFYDGVEADPVLLSLYPDPDDLGPAAERLALFLAQYWGGPTTYSDRRGHPRLRMRHAPYRIDAVARDHWLAAMTSALSATLRSGRTRADDGGPGGLEPGELEVVERQFVDYFTMAAAHLVNDPT